MFLREQDALAGLTAALVHEPRWADLLHVDFLDALTARADDDLPDGAVVGDLRASIASLDDGAADESEAVTASG